MACPISKKQQWNGFMKHLPNIFGGLLGFAFIAFSLMFFLGMMPEQPAPPEGSPVAMFMGAMMPGGYMHFVKCCELLGGILVAIPLTRNFGLLLLGPVIVNILAFHAFISGGQGLFDPVLIIICLIAAYLLWDARGKFLGLLNRRSTAP
ncbi:MAG: putative oxidoreductase [Verrucomicrobiales bacterium]|jgi:putative oxidoreductase